MAFTKQHIHLIAIGGSVMHTLAIALKQEGHEVTGSDDEIFEPSRTALADNGLLPATEGWNPERIHAKLDVVILGMHARRDNPELAKATELGLKIYSFPEYIYERSKDKQRIVIAGSHGKTTITSIIIHVLNYFNRKFDFVVGAKVKGMETSIRLSDAPIIIIEGDEYLSSALDPTPKFLRYNHHIGLISGISWDHANVFPSEDEYVNQFDRFADNTPKSGILLYCEQDPMALMIGKKDRADVQSIPYRTHTHTSDGNGKFYLTSGNDRALVQLFGSHNYQNLSGAREVLKKIGIGTEQFLKAIESFQGAAGRLERIGDNDVTSIYKDFAHAPSKLKASIKAVKELYPKRDLVACYELHTFSSLNKSFLPQYKDTMRQAEIAIIYFDPKKVKAKELPEITSADVIAAFGLPSLILFTDSSLLKKYLQELSWKNKNLLMMSSGTFGGLNLQELASNLLK